MNKLNLPKRIPSVVSISKKLLLFVALIVLRPENGVSVTPFVFVVPTHDVSGAYEPGPYGGFLQPTTNFTSFTVFRYFLPMTDEEEFEYTNSALTVYLSRTGTAYGQRDSASTNPCYPNITDYYIGNTHRAGTNTAPPGLDGNAFFNEAVIIPAGEVSVDIPIWPVLDYQCEDTETVGLAVLPDSSYFSTNEIATQEIYDTQAAFSFHNIHQPIRLHQGDNFNFEISRSCGSASPSYLWQTTEVTNQFVLYGAQLGTDYTLSSNGTHFAITTASNLTVLFTRIPISNDTITVTFTALTNNLFGGTKTISVAPLTFYEGGCPQSGSTITLMPEGMPVIHSETFNTNVGFQFSILGENNSLCFISASTNLINWTNIGSVTLTNSTNIFTDSQASNFLNRFYRVHYTP